MKQSNLTFIEGFLILKQNKQKKQNKTQKAFDWDKAAKIIKEKYKEFPNLIAEAGLQGDWEYTGGVIFENGEPTNDNYTYLSSNWATPTLLLFDGYTEIDEIDCSIEKSDRFNADTKWDEQSLKILKN